MSVFEAPFDFVFETEAFATSSEQEPARVQAAPLSGSLVIVVPTAINVVLLASENIVDNLKGRNAASLALPSLYKRAFLIAYVTDEIAVAKGLR